MQRLEDANMADIMANSAETNKQRKSLKLHFGRILSNVAARWIHVENHVPQEEFTGFNCWEESVSDSHMHWCCTGNVSEALVEVQKPEMNGASRLCFHQRSSRMWALLHIIISNRSTGNGLGHDQTLSMHESAHICPLNSVLSIEE